MQERKRGRGLNIYVATTAYYETLASALSWFLPLKQLNAA